MASVLVRRGGLVLQMFYDRFPSKVLLDKSSEIVRHVYGLHQRSLHLETTVITGPPVKSKTVPRVQGGDMHSEKYIPITRRSLIRQLMEEENFVNKEEEKKFDSFTLSLDSAILNKYHDVLQQLKLLFDPINPDKDTVVTRSLNRRERLDNEFWLLQKLAIILDKANFRELPRSEIERALSEHQARDGVMVSVDVNKYDVIRYWVLGKEIPKEEPTFVEQLVMKVLGKPLPKTEIEYYKRVVVAVRLKRDDKLLLKIFKEVPVNALEQLLPDGRVKMRKFDWGLMVAATTVASAGVLMKLVTHLADVSSDWMLATSGVAAFIAFQGWNVYKKRKTAYLLDLNRMLYFKNIANNCGLLSLLVDRAEDEMFKECLLTYTFLLANRPPTALKKPITDQCSDDLGCLTKTQLEERVQDWVFRKTNSKIIFMSDEAINLLKEFGILSQDSELNLRVQPLDAALKNLPITVQSLALDRAEYDLEEGYDKDINQETDAEYHEEDKKRRSFGWF